MTDSAQPHTQSGHRHRVLVAVLLTLAVVMGFVAIFSTWVKRQALDTNNWTDTSSHLLADKKIQTVLGGYLVNELFSNVDVAGQLRAALPKQAAGLAGPAATGLRDLADQAAPRLLARPRVQSAWRDANRAAHRELIAILNGGSSTVSTSNGEVTLNLHQLVQQLAGTLGFGSQVAAAQSKLQGSGGAAARQTAQQKLGVTLPPSSGQLVILRSNQLKTAQDIAKLVRHLSIWSTVLTFVFFGAALALAAGRRRLTLRTVGWCFVGVGVFTLLLRRVGGDQIVDSLVRAESVKPAAHDAWSIATSLLYSISISVVIYGLLLVLAAWLAGDTRSALAVRRALAPSLRERPVLVYGVAAFVYLLVLLWGPTPAFRNWIPVVLIAALVVFGIELLRRQAVREFPDAQAGDTVRRMQHWYHARREHRAVPEPATGNGARVDQLERLASLHDSGALTDAEYDTEKALLLASH
jgi:hypothetical protein